MFTILAKYLRVWFLRRIRATALLARGLSRVTLLALLSSFTSAQTDNPQERAQRAHEERLKQEQLRREDEVRRNLRESDIFLQESPQELEWPAGAEGECFEVHTIDVQGARQFDAEQVEAVTEAFVGQCLDLNDVNRLVRDLSNLYLERGYVTSRAYIQPQNIEDGVLEILVIEGRLESLESVERNLSERQLRWAFPAESEDSLNLRDLEQGLENINRLQQNRAQMDLEPGPERGSTVVVVKNHRSGRFSGGLGANDRGSEATGEHLATAFLSWDNPTFSNDNLYLSVSQAADAPELAESNSYSLVYTLPYRYTLFSYSVSYFEYQQQVSGAVVDFLTNGTSLSQTLSADHWVYRGQADKLAITTSLTRKESQNYLEDVFLETSSRVLYLFSLGARYTRYTELGVLRASAAWQRSEDWLDATTPLVSAENEYQFDKLTADLSFSSQGLLGRQSLSYETTLSLFYTPDEVIVSEALSLGGEYTVRGIEGGSLTGHSGGYWRQELHQDFVLGRSGSLRLTAGLDVGNTDTPEFPEHSREWLVGAMAGISYRQKWFSLALTYAEPLESPDYLNLDSSVAYASLQTYF